MHERLALQGLRKVYLLSVVIFLVILIVLGVASFFVTRAIKESVAESFVLSQHNNLVSGSYKELLITIGALVPNNFRSVKVVINGETEFVPPNQMLSSWEISSIEVSYSNHIHFVFYYSLARPIFIALSLWLSIIVIYLVLLVGFWGQLEKVIIKRARDIEQEKFFYIARKAAHDIRGPLSFLRVLSQSLSKNDQNESFRRNIETVIERIEAVASDILDKSREESVEELTDIKRLILGITNLLKRQNPKVDFTVDGPTFLVSGRGVDYERHVTNLIQNALDAKSDDINIRLSLGGNAKIGHLEVSDNGKGISKPILKRLNRGNSVTTKEKGNGVGLSSLFSYVKSKGGRVRIDSTLTKGTRVVISLPVTPTV